MTSPDPERLLREVRWMRALARELAGGAGEDVAQEACVAALTRSEGGGNFAAWLSGVVRNLARRAHRAEASRCRRERAAARAEALPATDELVAEGELQQRLVTAVMALDEPYRETVLLHYFRGLALVEIARRAGLPDGTVRTRLRRALARLRAELDEGCGGSESWALVALGGIEPAGVFGGGVVVGTKAKLALTGVVGLLGVVAWRASREEGAREFVAASSATVGVESGPAVSEAAPPGRELDSAEVAVRQALDEPTPVAEVLLHGTAHDREVQEVEVWASAEDEWGEAVRMEGAALGAWSLSGLHPGRWRLRVAGEGLAMETREVVLDEAVETLDLVFERTLPILVRVVDENGNPLTPVDGPLGLVASRAPPTSGQLGTRMDVNQLFGVASLGQWSPDTGQSQVPPGYFGLVLPGISRPFYVSLVSRQDVLETRRVEGSITEITFQVELGSLQRRGGRVSVRYIDGVSGEPLAGVHASVTYPEVSVRKAKQGAASDEDGRIQFDSPTPGLWMLHSVGEGRAYSTRAVRVVAGETTEVGDVRLWPTAVVAGRAIDEDGDAHGVSFRWLPVGSSPLDFEIVNYSHGGQFSAKFMPATRLWLLVRAEGFGLQCVPVDARGGAVSDLELRLVRGQRVVLRHGPADIGRQASVVTAEGGPIGSWSLGASTTTFSLVPGAYELWTGVAERVDERTPFVIGDGPLVLELPPASR
jgi:RNA polymerase sigma-70 factor (ECF subfamily)